MPILVYLDDIIIFSKTFEETLAKFQTGDGTSPRTQTICQSKKM